MNVVTTSDSATARAVPEKPYKGLEPFAEQDAPFFFGRPGLRDRVIANLQSTRLTLLYGESGVGKSSLLRAGVAARLWEQARENLARRGTPGHAVVVWRDWRRDPIAGLKEAVQEAVATALGEPGFAPPIFGSTLADVLLEWSSYLNGYLLIILDQFEDYLLYHPRSEAPDRPDEQLIRAINQADLRVNVLLSIREDALSRLDRFNGRIPFLFDNYLRVERLDPEQAREAIVGPLRAWDERGLGQGRTVGIDPDLVERLLQEIPMASLQLSEIGSGTVPAASGSREIPAPYLQLVLERLWDWEDEQGSSYLHTSTLDELRGVAEIVRTHLDTVMEQFSDDQQAIAAAIFRQLVTPSGQKIAHRVTDLAENAGVDPAQVGTLAEALAGEPRILRPVPAPLDDLDRSDVDDPGWKLLYASYEIYHDALANAILRWRREFDARRIREEEQRLKEEALAEQATREEQEREELRRQEEDLRRQEAERRRRQVIRILSWAVAACLVATIFAVLQAFEARQNETLAVDNARIAYYNATDAAEQRQLAMEEAAEARRNADLALTRQAVAVAAQGTAVAAQAIAEDSRATASTAQAAAEALREQAERRKAALELGSASASLLDQDPQLSLLLALEASRLTFRYDHLIPREIQQDLHRAIKASRLELLFPRHNRGVNSLAYSPDGSRVVSVDSGGWVRVWAADSGDPLFEVQHPGQNPPTVRGVAFNSDGARFATASDDGTALIWDAASARPLTTIDAAGPVHAVAFSPDGTRLATAGYGDAAEESPGSAALWNVGTGERILTLDGHRAAVLSIAFSLDGLRVATGSADWEVRVWDVDGDRATPRWQRHRTDERVRSVAFSPDGGRVASAHGSGSVHIWNVEDGREVADILAHTDGTWGVTFSQDKGGRCPPTSGADRRARIWDSSTFAELLTLVGSSEGLRTLAFAPSGDRLATGGADWAVRVWSTVFEFNHGATIRDVAFSPNGIRLATAGEDGRGMIWDAASGSKIRELPHGVDSDFKLVHRIVFSPDGTRVVTAGANARAKIWDAVSGALLWTLCSDDLDEATRQLACHVNEIDDAEFSPDGGTLATASRDQVVRLWAVRSGEYLGRLGDPGGPGDHPSWVSSVAFSPDGTLIATGCWDGYVRLWDASTRQFRLTLTSPFRHAVLRLAFSADGRLAAARLNGDVEIWDVTSTSRLSGWPAHGGRANDVAFPPAISPTGLVLATAGEDRTAKLWGAGADWDLRLVLTQQAGVDGVAFSPDGVRLAAGGASRQASIYVVDEQSLLALAATRAKRELTPEECQRYLRQPTCPSSP